MYHTLNVVLTGSLGILIASAIVAIVRVIFTVRDNTSAINGRLTSAINSMADSLKDHVNDATAYRVRIDERIRSIEQRVDRVEDRLPSKRWSKYYI